MHISSNSRVNAAPEKLHEAILIYSPSYEIRNAGSVTVTIQLNDDKPQTIQFVPVADSSSYSAAQEKIKGKLQNLQMLRL